MTGVLNGGKSTTSTVHGKQGRWHKDVKEQAFVGNEEITPKRIGYHTYRELVEEEFSAVSTEASLNIRGYVSSRDLSLN